MTPYIFCEPCAGSAAVSYGLLGCKPPISYMGSKSGYLIPIMEALGLSRLSPPAAFVLGEPGPWAAVHAALGGATGCSAEDVAGWLHVLSLCVAKNGKMSGYSHVNGEGHDFVSRDGKQQHWTATSPESNGRRLDALPHPAAPIIADIIRSWKDEEPRALWERLKAKGWPSLLLPEGSEGRWLGPQSVEEVAGWLLGIRWSFSEKGPEKGYGGPGCEVRTAPGGWTTEGRDKALSIDRFSSLVGSTPPFPPLAVWQGTAETMPMPSDLSRWVIYVDPPYSNTTGYPHGDLSRAEVLRLALDWSARGARVAISEAEPLPLEGWHHVQIDHARRGQARTFSKQKHEWLTMNYPPHHWPGKQEGLFGGGG